MRLAILLAVAALAVPAAAAGQSPGTPASTQSVTMTAVAELEGQVLVALNAVRKEHGLVPLRANAGLANAARGHSRQMAQLGYFEHASYDGSAFWTRIKPLYKPLPRRKWGAGENMVWSSPGLSADQAVLSSTVGSEAWNSRDLKSRPH